MNCPHLVVFGKVMEPLDDGVSLQEAVSREGGWVTHLPTASGLQCVQPPAFSSALLLTKNSISTTGKELENTDLELSLIPRALRRQDYHGT